MNDDEDDEGYEIEYEKYPIRASYGFLKFSDNYKKEHPDADRDEVTTAFFKFDDARSNPKWRNKGKKAHSKK